MLHDFHFHLTTRKEVKKGIEIYRKISLRTMGGTSSKQDAFVGSNGDRSKDEPPCSCFTPFFCPPEKHNQNTNRSSTSRRSSFGTPLPDTPEQVRRIRDHDHAKGFYSNEEANGGVNRILKYDGLEREVSGMFLNEMGSAEKNGHGGSSSGGLEDQRAEIHDGKVSVVELTNIHIRCVPFCDCHSIHLF